MIRFFHTADVHFGVENYGRIDPKTGIHSRLGDFKQSFDTAVDAAIAEGVDFFLLCGDAYKTAYPTPTQQKLLIESLLKLHDAGIHVIIVVGNHDHPLSFGKAHALDVFSSFPLNNFHVFSKPDVLTLQTKSGPVQIVGIPWPTKNNLITHEAHRFKDQHEVTSYISEKIGELIASFAQKLDPSIPSILCGHLTVSSGIFSGSEKCAVYGSDPLFLPSQLAIQPFSYVALGHLHRHQNLNPGGIPIVYSGSIERVDFGERKEEKGYCVVSLTQTSSENWVAAYEFRIVPSRPMIQLEIQLSVDGDQTEQVIKAIEGQQLEQAIVKIVYHIPEERQDKVDLAAVLRACQKAHYLVGIFPIHKVTVRAARAHISTHMNFETAVTRYLETRKELSGKKEFLLQKAISLRTAVELEAEEAP